MTTPLPPQRGPVMSDVAARADVSHQTVPRGINGHPHVSGVMRALVEPVLVPRDTATAPDRRDT
jgi:hypothetical protein